MADHGAMEPVARRPKRCFSLSYTYCGMCYNSGLNTFMNAYESFVHDHHMVFLWPYILTPELSNPDTGSYFILSKQCEICHTLFFCFLNTPVKPRLLEMSSSPLCKCCGCTLSLLQAVVETGTWPIQVSTPFCCGPTDSLLLDEPRCRLRSLHKEQILVLLLVQRPSIYLPFTTTGQIPKCGSSIYKVLETVEGPLSMFVTWHTDKGVG